MNRIDEFDDDWLDHLLRRPPEAVDDGGFTDRVMASLRRRRRLRAVVLAATGLSGFALSVWMLPPAKFLAALVETVAALQAPAGHVDLLALAATGLFIWLVAREA